MGLDVVVALMALVLVLLTVVVASLLRSHAEIVRLLHHLGADLVEGELPSARSRIAADTGRPSGGPARSGSAPDVAGLTPTGDARALALSDPAADALLVFLSSGCERCEPFWDALAAGRGAEVGVRVVVVTRSNRFESPSILAARRGIDIVASDDAWDDYAVPGSPYAVMVSGGRVVGEGTAITFEQLASLARQATDDRTLATRAASAGPTPPSEDRADADLLALGVRPGDERLDAPNP